MSHGGVISDDALGENMWLGSWRHDTARVAQNCVSPDTLILRVSETDRSHHIAIFRMSRSC